MLNTIKSLILISVAASLVVILSFTMSTANPLTQPPQSIQLYNFSELEADIKKNKRKVNRLTTSLNQQLTGHSATTALSSIRNNGIGLGISRGTVGLLEGSVAAKLTKGITSFNLSITTNGHNSVASAGVGWSF